MTTTCCASRSRCSTSTDCTWRCRRRSRSVRPSSSSGASTRRRCARRWCARRRRCFSASRRCTCASSSGSRTGRCRTCGYGSPVRPRSRPRRGTRSRRSSVRRSSSATARPRRACASPIASAVPIMRVRSGSRYPGIRTRVIDPASLADVADGEVGELLINGPNVFSGYYKNPQATKDAFVVDADGARWFRSGDLARFDPGDSQLRDRRPAQRADHHRRIQRLPARDRRRDRAAPRDQGVRGDRS